MSLGRRGLSLVEAPGRARRASERGAHGLAQPPTEVRDGDEGDAAQGPVRARRLEGTHYAPDLLHPTRRGDPAPGTRAAEVPRCGRDFVSNSTPKFDTRAVAGLMRKPRPVSNHQAGHSLTREEERPTSDNARTPCWPPPSGECLPSS